MHEPLLFKVGVNENLFSISVCSDDHYVMLSFFPPFPAYFEAWMTHFSSRNTLPALLFEKSFIPSHRFREREKNIFLFKTSSAPRYGRFIPRQYVMHCLKIGRGWRREGSDNNFWRTRFVFKFASKSMAKVLFADIPSNRDDIEWNLISKERDTKHSVVVCMWNCIFLSIVGKGI